MKARYLLATAFSSLVFLGGPALAGEPADAAQTSERIDAVITTVEEHPFAFTLTAVDESGDSDSKIDGVVTTTDEQQFVLTTVAQLDDEQSASDDERDADASKPTVQTTAIQADGEGDPDVRVFIDKIALERKALEGKEVPKLDELISRALKFSPRIKEARAQLQLVQAQLAAVQLELTEQVSEQFYARERAKLAIQQEETQFERLVDLRKKNVITEAEVVTAKMKVDVARQELAQAELRLKTLTGGESPGVYVWEIEGGPQLSGTIDLSGSLNAQVHQERDQAADAADKAERPANAYQKPLQRTFAQLAEVNGIPDEAKIPGPLSDVLQKPVTLEVSEMELNDVLNFLSEQVDGELQFVYSSYADDLREVPVTLQLSKEVALRAALTALADVVPELTFVVRDYGILVTTRNHAVELGGAQIP